MIVDDKLYRDIMARAIILQRKQNNKHPENRNKNTDKQINKFAKLLADIFEAPITDAIHRYLTQSALITLPCKVIILQDIILQGYPTIDGVQTTDGDRVLVNKETNKINNGIYIVSSQEWERADDFDEDDELMNGIIVPIKLGESNAGTTWRLATPNPIKINVSELVFVPNSTPDQNGKEFSFESSDWVDIGDSYELTIVHNLGILRGDVVIFEKTLGDEEIVGVSDIDFVGDHTVVLNIPKGDTDYRFSGYILIEPNK